MYRTEKGVPPDRKELHCERKQGKGMGERGSSRGKCPVNRQYSCELMARVTDIIGDRQVRRGDRQEGAGGSTRGILVGLFLRKGRQLNLKVRQRELCPRTVSPEKVPQKHTER